MRGDHPTEPEDPTLLGMFPGSVSEVEPPEWEHDSNGNPINPLGGWRTSPPPRRLSIRGSYGAWMAMALSTLYVVGWIFSGFEITRSTLSGLAVSVILSLPFLLVELPYLRAMRAWRRRELAAREQAAAERPAR